VVGGNAITEKSGVTQNNFFRNGVAINAAPNGKAEAVSLEDQEKLAKIPEVDIAALPGGGGVAFWHTLPYQFAVKAIDLGVPAELNTPDRRQKWLEIIRLEMLAALGKAENSFRGGSTLLRIKSTGISLEFGCKNSRSLGSSLVTNAG
jgi:hypothetical protein